VLEALVINPLGTARGERLASTDESSGGLSSVFKAHEERAQSRMRVEQREAR